jgi:imidazolonepropionase-like amidohydrolase
MRCVPQAAAGGLEPGLGRDDMTTSFLSRRVSTGLRRPAVILLLGLAFLAARLSAASPITAVKAGYVVDPSTGKLLPAQVILVQGGMIKAMGPDLTIPEGAAVIDLSGYHVLPGLIDGHTHVCELISGVPGFAANYRAHYLLDTTLDRALQGVANLRSFLEAGFTTLRDMGNAGEYADIALKKALARGHFAGPRLLVAGKIIAPFAGQNVVNYDDPDYARRDYLYADTRDEMRKAIRENIQFGADWIKIVIDDQRYIYSADDVRFIVEEAKAAGFRVAAHALTERGIRHAVEGGVATLEHGFQMSDDLIREAKAKGIWLCGTELSKEAWAVYGVTQIYAGVVDRLKRAHKIGLPMAFGSDLIVDIPGYSRGAAALTITQSWIDAGIPAPDILKAMTWDAARMLGQQERLGVVKFGGAADLIAVAANPLEDIKALRNVAWVMKAGVVYKDVRTP